MRLKNHYLVLRHGQTFYQISEKKLAYPWPEKKPILLTKEGEKQIEEAAKRLKKASIDFIYASDVSRARHSASIVKKIIKFKKRIIFDKRLREIGFGIFNSKSVKSFEKYFKSSQERVKRKVPGGENYEEVLKRVFSFLAEIDKKYKDKNILIVSHQAPLLLLSGKVKGYSILKSIKSINNIFGEKRIAKGELIELN